MDASSPSMKPVRRKNVLLVATVVVAAADAVATVAKAVVVAVAATVAAAVAVIATNSQSELLKPILAAFRQRNAAFLFLKIHSAALSATTATTAFATFAAGADAQRRIERAEADEGGEQRHCADGSKPGVIDDAVGDEAEAEDDAQSAVDGSDVGFHISVGVRGENVCWP